MTAEVRARPLIQPIERNAGGEKTVALTLPSCRPSYRQLRLEWYSQTLDAALYVRANHAHAAYAVAMLSEWRMNIDTSGALTLWYGGVCFKLNGHEGASVRAFLEPLGVRITRHP